MDRLPRKGESNALILDDDCDLNEWESDHNAMDMSGTKFHIPSILYARVNNEGVGEPPR